MGHYYSEMYSDDRTPEQIEETKKKFEREKQLKNKICEVFDCDPKEIKIIYDILKESIRNQ